ncbi:unnamed protein product [Pipistrellus nathusii]|uniref:Uncharacterized protein n=1 Tax=Pipistrellus nathusii TaxID=59473 RepID=A0ABN9ZSK7_PIPNA
MRPWSSASRLTVPSCKPLPDPLFNSSLFGLTGRHISPKFTRAPRVSQEQAGLRQKARSIGPTGPHFPAPIPVLGQKRVAALLEEEGRKPSRVLQPRAGGSGAEAGAGLGPAGLGA